MLVKRFGINKEGRDIAVGDIHGHFSYLQRELNRIKFDPTVDRLFSVGDLVDRGPENKRAFEWLSYPWFHPVMGNHDHHVARWDTVESWLGKAGKWFSEAFNDEEKVMFAAPFQDLPVAIEVETKYGIVGLVHAECPFDDWNTLLERLGPDQHPRERKLVANSCMYSRRKFEFKEKDRVQNIRAVVVGHNPVKEVLKLGNTYFIDTEGWKPRSGKFTLFNLNGLQAMR